MRWEILLRDGKDCVPCRILGYCDPKGRGWCSGNQLVSPDLKDVAYRKLDALRSDNASLRMHLSHLHGKSNNGWLDLVTSCACHNLEITTEIRRVCEEYVEPFEGTDTDAFLEAAANLPAEKKASKESKAKARHAIYEKQKVKAGGTLLSKQKSKRATKTAPAVGRKYASSRWKEFDALPRFNSNP